MNQWFNTNWSKKMNETCYLCTIYITILLLINFPQPMMDVPIQSLELWFEDFVDPAESVDHLLFF